MGIERMPQRMHGVGKHSTRSFVHAPHVPMARHHTARTDAARHPTTRHTVTFRGLIATSSGEVDAA